MKIITSLKEKLINYNINKNIKNFKIGDIIWAKRYTNNNEFLALEKGHTEGPFIIIKKKKNSILCLYCTSVTKHLNWPHLFYELNKYDYNLTKSTYVQTNKTVELQYKEYCYQLSSLNKEDLNTIIKKIILISKSNYNTSKLNININKLKYYYTKGDIILYKNIFYYILDKNNNYYHLIKLKSSHNKEAININNKEYLINFSNIIKVKYKVDKKFILKDIATPNKILSLEAKYKNNSKALEEENTIKRGSIIRQNQKIYFLYGEYKNTWLTIELFEEIIKGLPKININNITYSSNFKESYINKSNTLILIANTNEETIKKIASLRKQERGKAKNKPTLCKKIHQRCLLIESNTLDKYLVISRHKNIITCLNLETKEKKRFNLKNNYSFNVEKQLEFNEFINLIKN